MRSLQLDSANSHRLTTPSVKAHSSPARCARAHSTDPRAVPLDLEGHCTVLILLHRHSHSEIRRLQQVCSRWHDSKLFPGLTQGLCSTMLRSSAQVSTSPRCSQPYALPGCSLRGPRHTSSTQQSQPLFRCATRAATVAITVQHTGLADLLISEYPPRVDSMGVEGIQRVTPEELHELIQEDTLCCCDFYTASIREGSGCLNSWGSCSLMGMRARFQVQAMQHAPHAQGRNSS